MTRRLQLATPLQSVFTLALSQPLSVAWAGTPEVRIATVTNFPHGNDDIEIAVAETKAAVAYSANEVDVVFPHTVLLLLATKVGFELVKQCKTACGDITLKVIIETGELKKRTDQEASQICIEAGADFIKTSTGKSASKRDSWVRTHDAWSYSLFMGVAKTVGFKPAGGVRTAEDAQAYLAMADELLGAEWADNMHYRFGASSLLTNLLNTLEVTDQTADQQHTNLLVIFDAAALLTA